MKSVVIFGGTGFIGVFTTKYILENNLFDRVYLYDIESISDKNSMFRSKFFENDIRVKFIRGDVRKKILFEKNDDTEKIELIINLAAIHREPGHKYEEYFDTNIPGAKNICNFADEIKCNKIIFTSSISPYGPTEELVDELSLPNPNSAYGKSKLQAEEIHKSWCSYQYQKKLLILRPGVVFGPGESGNVTRLIKSVINHYFVYFGNKEIIKSGIYVKELINAMFWCLKIVTESKTNELTANMSMHTSPKVIDYVNACCKTKKISRFIPNVPFRIIFFASKIIEGFCNILKIQNHFSPVRVMKLIKSNNIRPSFLIKNNYNYIFTLEEAFRDWYEEYPNDWR